MTQVVGYAIKTGSFTPSGSKEAVEYNNIILYLISDIVPNVEGYMAFECKIKFSDFAKITNGVKAKDLVGNCIEMNYISTGKQNILCSIKVIEEETEKAAS